MGKSSFPEKVIFVCDGKKCGRHGEVRKYCKHAIKEHGLKQEVEMVKMECTDRCKQAPVMCFQPGNQWFVEVSEKQVRQLFNDIILK